MTILGPAREGLDMPEDPFPPRRSSAPPNDEAAERAVLGAMLLSTDAIDDVRAVLKRGHFYREIHATIFDTVCALADAGRPVDALIVADALHTDGALTKVGGAPYLHTLIAEVPLAANGGHYAQIVRRVAVMRRIGEAGDRLSQLARATGYDAEGAVEMAHKTLEDLDDSPTDDDMIALGDLWQNALDDIETAAQPDEQNGVATGFKDLDRLLNGMRPGQLVVVAGRPAMGKSVLALDIARQAAIHDRLTVGFFSLEMTNTEIVTRLLAAETRVPLHALLAGNVADDEWSRIARRIGDIGPAPLYFDDSTGTSLASVARKARRLKQRQGRLDLVIVDYLQLMSVPGGAGSREREVAMLTRGLKNLAGELGCPIIAVAQLNRGPATRQDTRPKMSDLRESGAIENDAAIVLLIHRDDYYDAESPRAGEADIIVEKNRNGAKDTVTVAAQLHVARFVDMAMS